VWRPRPRWIVPINDALSVICSKPWSQCNESDISRLHHQRESRMKNGGNGKTRNVGRNENGRLGGR